jgi:hypothetical protein
VQSSPALVILSAVVRQHKKPNMKLFCIIILYSFIPGGLIGQINCVDFNDYDSSQVWIKGIIKLDKEAQKDSALQRIKCERILGEDSVNFSLICIIDGLIANAIPDYRDSLLKRIDSQNMELIGSLCEMKGVYPEKCELGFLLISGLEKPVINNISNLTIKGIERKKGTISITIKSLKSDEFDFKIEDFQNTENSKTVKKHLKKGTNRMKFSVDNELKLITILDDENKLIMIK